MLLCVCVLCCCVFLQAEDGIRDLVRSRGLGDVYKRQDKVLTEVAEKRLAAIRDFTELGSGFKIALKDLEAVSYTHLTLPTSDLV